jgi:hypothetical protein
MFGKSTTGMVIDYKGQWGRHPYMTKTEITHSIIRYYYSKDGFIDFVGPEDVKYPLGKKVKIFYDKSNPQKHVMFNAAGLILNNKMILPGVALILWLAFYLTMRELYRKKTDNIKNWRHFKSLRK